MHALSSTRRRGASLVTAAAAAVLLLTACGSASSTSSTSDAGAREGFAAYAQCLSDNGVTLPSGRPGGAGGPGEGTPPSGAPTGMPTAPPAGDPGGVPGGGQRLPEGVDASAFAKAQEACASLRPTGGPGRGPVPGGAGVDASALAAYTSCLSDHDVTVSSPADLRTLDTSDKTVAAALATCAPLRPTPSASPSASTPASG